MHFSNAVRELLKAEDLFMKLQSLISERPIAKVEKDLLLLSIVEVFEDYEFGFWMITTASSSLIERFSSYSHFANSIDSIANFAS